MRFQLDNIRMQLGNIRMQFENVRRQLGSVLVQLVIVRAQFNGMLAHSVKMLPQVGGARLKLDNIRSPTARFCGVVVHERMPVVSTATESATDFWCGSCFQRLRA